MFTSVHGKGPWVKMEKVMLAIRAEASEPNLADLFYVEPKPFRFNRKTAFAITAVAGIYAALGAGLALQKWVLAPLQMPPESKMDVRTYRPIVPDEPKRQVDQPPHQPPMVEPEPTISPRLVEAIVPTADITPIQAVAQPTPPPVGPVALLTTPPLPPTFSTASRPTPPAMIFNPDWIGKPTAAQANNVYPSRALRLGMAGHAELVCTVQVSGTVAGCQVASETGSYGFGAAALALAPYFKMKPRTIDGQAVEGAKVRIPVDFNTG